MRKPSFSRSLIGLSLVSVLACVSGGAFASAFQLWEQGEADIGDYHAGAAAIADDPSTEFYNPAGLTRLKHQAVSVGAAALFTDIRFSGNVNVNTMIPKDLGRISNVNGGGTNVIPNMHYVLPINDRFVLGFGVTAPLGLQTDYRHDTVLRYSATKTSIQVINVGPSLGYKATKHFSLGAGVDFQRLSAEFDEYGGYAAPGRYDTSDINRVWNWGYGYHVGALYEFTPSIRIGLGYHSKVVHHATGNSVFEGKLASPIPYTNPSELRSDRLSTTLVTPATTQLSYYQDINDRFSWMTTVTYTEHGAFNALRLQHAAGLDHSQQRTTDLTIEVPQYFRNTWNLALGGLYNVDSRWQLKAGLGYDQTPITTRYRTVQAPDGDRYVVACGAHFQADRALGLDFGWAHLFLRPVGIHSSILVGPERTNVNGTVSSSADVLGLQVTYTFV